MEASFQPTPRPAFLFYESFFEAIKQAPEEEQGRLALNLIACGLGQDSVDRLPYPDNAIIRQMVTNVEYADRRYYAAHHNGEKGGRPRIEVDLELAQSLYVEKQNWDEVAKTMGISRSTLSRARKLAGQI